MANQNLVLAIDQGTSSSRAIVFDCANGEPIAKHQQTIEQITPKEGWFEHDAAEMWIAVETCLKKAAEQLGDNAKNIKAIGITNQRESLVVWDKKTGEPIANCIVWCDTRTSETVDEMKAKSTPAEIKKYEKLSGLTLFTYFTALKMRWLMKNDEKVKEAANKGECLIGTIDTWLVWKLTGGVDGGVHVTDVTNASRTMLMDIHSLQWDDKLCKWFEIPKGILPKIVSSSEVYGNVKGPSLEGVPVAGILGDQQAALVGQGCFKEGQVKNTYGTGCFLLYNTGKKAVISSHGLLTTVAYKFGKDPAVYALEGSVAVAGQVVRWLKDQLGLIKSSDEIEELARSVETSGGCYFVPAFSGLFCPHWDTSARGVICGLTHFVTKAHIARASLEAVCFQTAELLEAMNQDSGCKLKQMQVDGGMSKNKLLMEMQAEIANVKVVRPSNVETTALGAAMAAGSAVGVWDVRSLMNKKEDDKIPASSDVFDPDPNSTPKDREGRFKMWKEAVNRSKKWLPPGEDCKCAPDKAKCKSEKCKGKNQGTRRKTTAN